MSNCQRLYQTLLLSTHEKNIPASAFIREFYESIECDDEFNFKPLRDSYKKRLSNDRLDRILEFKENDMDEKIAAQVCFHYSTEHTKQLISALKGAERTLAMFGIVGSSYAGHRAAIASWKILKRNVGK